MNGEKPLNILADQLEKPDLEVTSGDLKPAQGTPQLAGQQNAAQNNPSNPTQQNPQTALQDELKQTLSQVIPKKAETPQPLPKQDSDQNGKPSTAPIMGGGKVFVQKPIRTYEGDIAEVLSHNKTSVASIAIAENKRHAAQASQQAPAPSTRKPGQGPNQRTERQPEQPAVQKIVINRVDAIPSDEVNERASKLYRDPSQNNSSAEFPGGMPQGMQRQIQSETQSEIPTIKEEIETRTETPLKIVEQPQKAQEIPQQVPIITSISDINSEEPRKGHARQAILGLLSIMLIGAGAVGGYYLYKKSVVSIPAPVIKTISSPSILPTDKQVTFDIDSIQNSELIPQIYSQFSKNTLPSGEIFQLILTNTIADPTQNNGAMVAAVTGSSIITKAGLNMPDLLQRSLTDAWVLGAYSEQDGSQSPFVIFTTDFFQNAFAGMLDWESTMPDDLSTFLNFKDKARAGEDTASTSIEQYFSINGQFVDKEIRNRDVREFIDSKGEILFLYSFIDNSRLVITTTESALAGIIDRIGQQTYVR